MGIGEVIRGSLSAEVGSLLIGVVSHAGSPRPESPERLGSIAHIGNVDEALMRAASAGEVSRLLCPAPSVPPKGRHSRVNKAIVPIHSRRCPLSFMRSSMCVSCEVLAACAEHEIMSCHAG